VSKSDVKISDEKIYYPYVDIPDILVVMSEQAYKKYSNEISKDTIVLIDKDLVKSKPRTAYYKIPANRIAKELHKEVVANVVMIGAICGITQIISKEVIERAILDNVPKGSEDMNRTALQKGYEVARKLKGSK
jgi:2-oxoglutarate ferredoxin oxidoreductase subunit gamma